MSAPLKYALWGMVVFGLAALGYVLVRASSVGDPSGLSRYGVGEMRNLEVLREPPARPGVTLVDADGGETTLAAYEGKVILVNLWATWCAPCVAEMPSLNALAAARNSDQFEVVPISLDRTLEEAAEFYTEYNLTELPLLLDNTFAVGRAVETVGLPVSVFYDARGREIARVPREADWAGEDALALVDAIVAREFPAPAAPSDQAPS